MPPPLTTTKLLPLMTSEFHDPKIDRPADEGTVRDVLRHFGNDLKSFWNAFGTYLLFIILGVLLVVVIKQRFIGMEQKRREQAYTALAAAQNPIDLEDLADE